MNKIKYLKYKKILLLEDDKVLLENYATTFKTFFNEVLAVDNCYEAYITYKEKRPDFIVADVHLQNDVEDGLDFIKRIREENKDIPIIVFSAMTDKDTFLKAIPLSLVEYLVKPISYSDIVALLLKYIKNMELSSDKYILDEEKNISFNLFTQELKTDDEIQKLPLNARKLLALLIQKKDNFISYEMIEDEIYFQKDFYLTTVRNHVSMLRNILGKEAIIVNVDQGYKLNL